MDRLEELKKQRDEILKQRDIYFKNTNDEYDEYMDKMSHYSDLLAPMNFEIQKIEEVIWQQIPEYGDIMTKEEFIEACNDGLFIDYDGSGNYASSTHMSNKSIHPSDVLDGRILDNEKFTHIIWFNK